MSMLFSGPPKPPPPIQPPPPPTMADASSFSGNRNMGNPLEGKMGKTLLTGGMGVTAPANTASKTLLGQ